MDRSNDPTVSFQTPTHLSPGQAQGAVAAHENEHVVHNAANAEQNDMVAHSSVSLHYAICPECGRMYVAGGKTTTTFSPKQQTGETESKGLGGNINLFA